MQSLFAASLAVLLAMTLACASRRPVLYPNDRLRTVGEPGAQQDVDACLAAAHHYVETGEVAETAERTVRGAAVGGAVGAATGAVRGRPGRGAATGAAGAAAGTLAGSLFRRGPHPMIRAFVGRCLREQGYDVLGWR